MAVSIQSAQINHSIGHFPYMTATEDAGGLRDIYSMYVPRGPIRKYVTYFRAGGGMPLYVGHSEYYEFDDVIRNIIGFPSINSGYRDGMFGGGKGHDIPGMTISGVAETFERALGAFGYFQKAGNIVLGTANSLEKNGLKCLGPEELPLFAPEQFETDPLISKRFVPFTDETFLGWVEGERLVSKEKIWVPAHVCLPFYLRSDRREQSIGYFTTGGLAVHVNREEAIYHGMLELIERDKVNLRWVCGQAPNQINIDQPLQSVHLKRLVDISKSLPIDFNFYSHDTEIEEVPVVTVIAYSPGFRQYAYYAGGGVGLDIEESMLYAVSEYGQSEGTLRALLLAPKWDLSAATRMLFDVEEDVDVKDIDMFFKIVSYYGYEKNFKKMNWYLGQGEKRSISSYPNSPIHTTEKRYAEMLNIIDKYHIDPIIFDLSPPQMKHLRLFRTFCPELAAPYVQNMPMLAHPRYYDMPQELGWADKKFTFDDLVKDPQPYP